MKQKLKFLIPFLIFVTVITLGMSGLYADLYNSLSDFFGEDETVEELVVQKVYAYNALSLQDAFESVGSVNILDLTLANDITYEGKCLQASQVSTVGSSTFYIDINGHNLDIKTDTSGGIIMDKSTFYAVDTVGGGHIDVDSQGGGILCKNLVIDGGNITVNAGGVDMSAVNSENNSGIVDSENVDEDVLGANWSGDNAYFGDGWLLDGTWIVDAVRVYKTATINGNVRFHYQWAGDYAYLQFHKQKMPCGIRVGANDWAVDGGVLNVDGGYFVATGPIGAYSNTIYFNGGVSEIFGSCGNGHYHDSAGNHIAYSSGTIPPMEAIVFSDPNGFDGALYIRPNATVFASVPASAPAIFSYCCKEFVCEGTLYSGCRSGYLSNTGDTVMNLENSFSGQPHNYPHVGLFASPVQKSAITIGSGDVVFQGSRAKAYLIGHDRTISVGQDKKGEWGFNADGKIGAGDPNPYSWTGYNTWPDFNTGNVYAHVGGVDEIPNDIWISSAQFNRIQARSPAQKNLTNFFDMSFQITHSGTYTQSGGAFVMARSFLEHPDTKSKEFNSAALFCAGLKGRSGNDYAINIEGAGTKAYFRSNEIAILTDHASMRVGSSAYVCASTDYGPERAQVTTTPNGQFQMGSVTWGTYCYKGISTTDIASGLGGSLLVENSGVMECNATGGSSGFSIGVDTGGTLKVIGGTLKANVDSNGTGSSTQHNYSIGIHCWSGTTISSGAVVESTAGAFALRQDLGHLYISGSNTKCTFKSRGGQLDYTRLGWGQDYNAPLSVSSVIFYGYSAYISGGTVDCSFVSGTAKKDAAIAAGGNVEVSGTGIVKCYNTEKGIDANQVKVSGDATVNISNVKTGMNGRDCVEITDASGSSATVTITAEQNGIVGGNSVNISGIPKVTVNSTASSTTSACIWSNAAAGTNAININLSQAGNVNASNPSGAYGIGTSAGNVSISGSGNVVTKGKTAGIHSGGNINISVTGKDSYVNSSGNEYGIRSVAATVISGPGTENVNEFSNVIASGNGTNGIGIYAGTTFSSSSCTLNASGTKHGINSVGVLTIGDLSTIDATSTAKTGYSVNSNSSVKISPYASLKTLGKTVENNGSVNPAPVSTINNATAYEVNFLYATVDNYKKDENGGIDVSTRDYKNEYFTSQIYFGEEGYSTWENHYEIFNKSYVGLGHNDHNLYIYLPAGSYLNYVRSYDITDTNKTNMNFIVDYGIAGYNKIDDEGEVMFNAKVPMEEYTKYSAELVSSPNVISKNITVYPLIPYSLEAFKIYDSEGNELKDGIKDAKGNLLSNSDGDEYFTWSEVKYYIENIASGSVDVEILKDSLAFSTITVPSGVTVNIYTSETKGVKLFRGTFDRNLHSHMEGIYVSPETGSFDFVDSTDRPFINNKLTEATLLPGYRNILKFYSPSDRKYNSETGYPENGDENNGLTLPLFHLNGTANIHVDSNILFDNVNIG
ncbi:MAG: hypothetical protein E7614_06960 [Ruminococcaceae bacterium]|nr:hypothetical protein [Oscillospiraceae bacterium]